MSDNTLSTPIMTLNNTNNVKIYSLGFNHNIYEILGSTAKVADDMDLYCANCSNIDIGGCYFTGSGDYCVAIGANQTNVNSHPEAVQPCYGAYYHGNFMNNTRSDGLDIMGGSGFVIEGNIFNNTGDDAIAYHGFGSHPVADIDVFANVIDNCNTNAMKFSNDGYQTILPDEMTDINIHGNIIDTTTNAGLMIKVTTLWGAVAPCAGVSFVSNMTFSDNIVRNTSQEGIVAEYSQTGALLPNFAITGNVFDHCGQNTNGLDFYGLTYSTVASNTFDNCASSGTTVIDMKNCSGNTITGNTICYSKLYGIVDDTGSGRNVFSNNLIANTAGTGIWLNTVAYDLCTSNYIVNAGVGGTGDGIQEWGSYDTIMMNKIYNCSRYRIYVHSGSSYADIEENDVRNGGSSTANGIKVLGTSCTVRRNIGWVTENSGSQANCVSGTTIVHGLAGTPNGQINAITNVTGEIVSITAVGSTTFTLGIMWWNGTTVDSSHSPCTIYWSAQYLP